jgi:hypothetical protein
MNILPSLLTALGSRAQAQTTDPGGPGYTDPTNLGQASGPQYPDLAANVPDGRTIYGTNPLIGGGGQAYNRGFFHPNDNDVWNTILGGLFSSEGRPGKSDSGPKSK